MCNINVNDKVIVSDWGDNYSTYKEFFEKAIEEEKAKGESTLIQNSSYVGYNQTFSNEVGIVVYINQHLHGENDTLALVYYPRVNECIIMSINGLTQINTFTELKTKDYILNVLSEKAVSLEKQLANQQSLIDGRVHYKIPYIEQALKLKGELELCHKSIHQIKEYM